MIAVISFEKHKGSFELNVLATMPLGFVVGGEAELASYRLVFGTKRMFLLFHVLQICMHVSISIK